jgi:hypothetical protein
MKRWLRQLFPLIFLLIGVYLIWQFWPAEDSASLPEMEIAVWMGVEWSMDAHSDTELEQLAQDLQAQKVDTAYVYLSYLRAGDSFNPTYDEAAYFIERMKVLAPEIVWQAWVGIPIAITQPDGNYEANRLQRPEIRSQIAEFAVFAVEELGFDGFHLNAELIPNDDSAFLQTLEAIREALPEDAIFSSTAHALRPIEPVTTLPYPHAPHHWTAEYLYEVSERVDQIALMSYDSALPFPRDFRSWMQYQTEAAAQALADSNVELFIGLPTSEEWTLTHQTQAENLKNALIAFSLGWSPRIDGIAIYPYWETTLDEWGEILAP